MSFECGGGSLPVREERRGGRRGALSKPKCSLWSLVTVSACSARRGTKVGRIGIFYQVIGLVLGLVQLAAILAQIESFFHIPTFVAAVPAFFLVSMPLIGALVGFFGAIDVFRWHWAVAIGVCFLGGWGAILLAYLMSKLFRYDDQ